LQKLPLYYRGFCSLRGSGSCSECHRARQSCEYAWVESRQCPSDGQPLRS